MSETKPVPLVLVGAPPPRYCPVCRRQTFSRNGIHPQCAEQQAEKRRVEAIKKRETEVKTATKAANALDPHKQWHRRCPECLRQVSVQLEACGCGYQFPMVTRSPVGHFRRQCPGCRSIVSVKRVTCHCGHRLRVPKPRTPKIVLRQCPLCQAQLPQSQLTCGCGYRFNPNSLLPHIGYHKHCPKCLAQIPINHAVCECGHAFAREPKQSQ